MDETLLCKDILGVIFSLLPGEYSTFVRLCKEAKSILITDGWDALIAHGVTVDITIDSIIWYKNGVIHRDNDLPAILKQYEYSWYKNGQVHRDGNKPATIVRDVDWVDGDGDRDNFFLDGYFVNGEMHRDNGPAYVNTCIETLEWYINGKLHRDNGPAVIFSSMLEYYKNDERHRDDGPAFICRYDTYTDIAWFRHNRLDNRDGLPVSYIRHETNIYSVYKRGVSRKSKNISSCYYDIDDDYKTVCNIVSESDFKELSDKYIQELESADKPSKCLLGHAGGIIDMSVLATM